MAEDKKPMSLNERNQLLLNGLSSSRTKPTEGKPQKVKLQGRRRLCKLSATHEYDDDEESEHNPFAFSLDSPSPPTSNSLHSPPPPPPPDSPPEQIRDILADLTSKLETLSIQKTRPSVVKQSDPLPFSIKYDSPLPAQVINKDDVPDYASAGSSFTLSPNPLPESDNVTKSESDGVNFVDMANADDVEENSYSHVVAERSFVSVDGPNDSIDGATRSESGGDNFLDAADLEDNSSSCVVPQQYFVYVDGGNDSIDVFSSAESMKEAPTRGARVKEEIGAYSLEEEFGGSRVNKQVRGSHVKEEFGGSHVNKEVRGSHVKEEVGAYRVKEGFQGARVNGEIGGSRGYKQVRGSHVNEEVGAYRVGEGFGGARVNEEIRGSRDYKEVRGSHVKEEVGAYRVREGFGGGRANEEIGGSHVNKEVRGGHVKEEVGAYRVREGFGGARVNEEIGGSCDYKEVRGSHVKEEVGAYRVREGFGGGRANEEIRGSHVNKEVRGGHVKEEVGAYRVRKGFGGARVNEEIGGSRVKEVVGAYSVKEGFGGGRAKDEVRGSHVKKELEISRGKDEYRAYRVKEEVGDVISIDDFEDGDDGFVFRGDNAIKSSGKTSSVNKLEDRDGGVVSDDSGAIVLKGKTSTYKLPSKLANMLYPHQREGMKWLWALHCRGTGGILGDDMGLGKTMQMCGFLAGLFHSRLIKRALVVAPKTLLAHWIKELSAVGLSHKIREYYGSCAKARQYELQYIFQDTGILLTTYDIVRNNSKSLRGDFYFNDVESEDTIIWDYTILDEGHIIKNPSTQRAKSLLEIPSAHRIIISGTPIQNNLKELWALFSFCCPELLGDKKEFKVKYESAILRGNEKNASDREKRVGSTVAKELRERIQPYFLRRLKSEVFGEKEASDRAKLSKKNEMIVWLRLTTCQRQLYEAFLKSELVLSSFQGSPLAALTVLKKICDHPFLLTKRAAEEVLEGMETMLNPEDLGVVERMALHLVDSNNTVASQNMAYNVSCKISFIMALLENLIPDGHNVLIFSQTRKMLNIVQESIMSKGYKFLRIDGTTKAIDREKIVNDFQEGEGAPIFLLTSQVGGLGLTLTKADRVIVVDPAWNPSTDNQSVDRAYRIGQKKDVIVYRLMTCGTIEEKIYKMQVFKGGLFRTATEQKEQTRYFSQKDLREIFRLPEQGFDVSLTQQQMHEEHDQQHIMDDSLNKHIKFLESQGIAGVSHHSLLFSKTAHVPVSQENEEMPRRKETAYVGSSSSNSLPEREVDGAEYALNPKDVNQWRKNTAVVNSNKPTESAVKDKLERLRQTLANKAILSKLPDKGERIVRQIGELTLELEKIRMADKNEVEVVDLDDISGKLQSVLHV